MWLLVGMFVLGVIARRKQRRRARPTAGGKRSGATASQPAIHVSSRTQRNHGRPDDARSAPLNVITTPQVNRGAPAEPAAATATTTASSPRPGLPVSDRGAPFEAPRINIGSLSQVNRGPNPVIVSLRTTVPAGKRPGKVEAGPTWHPPGSATTVAGRVIADGMIYVGKSGSHGPEGAGCVIDPSLPIGPAEKATALGYWPSYGDITAACRSVYLQWLSDGRRRPETDIGYVFLFFYGLERRLLVDRPAAQEASALIAEIHRLRSIYGANNSFEGYSRRLIGAATALAMQDAEFIPALDAQAGIFPMPLAVAIGRKIAAEQPLGFELAAAGLVGLPWDKGLQDNLVLKTVRPQFLEILRYRFERSYPGGFLPSGSAPEPLSPHYHPAAAGLQIDLVTAIGRLPDPSKLDWSELVGFARQVAQEIAPFGKLLAYHPERTETLAAAASCPPELAGNVGAEARRWLESLPRPISSIQFGELAMRAIGKSQQKWTLREHREVRDALMAFGRRIEPDPDDGPERLDSGTTVIVLEDPDPAAPRSPRFAAASAATHLVAGFAGSIAEGATVVEEAWLLKLRERLALHEGEVLRLRAKLAWARRSSAGLAKATRLLGNADPEDRTLSAWSATVAAVACGVPDKARIVTLEAIYDKLGVPRTHLYSTMHTAVAAGARGASAPVAIADPEASAPIVHAIPPPPEDGGNLSEERLRRVRAETEQVSVLLAEIFVEKEGPSSEANTNRTGGEFQGLDDAHTAFLRQLLTRPAWPRAELDAAAREVGLMTDGAVETINEWAFDRYEAPLLEDGDPLTVDATLLADSGGPAAA